MEMDMGGKDTGKKVKVLWICNVMLPRIAKARGMKVTPIGGWLAGLSDDLIECEGISLAVAFPMPGTKALVKGQAGALAYYGFSVNMKKIEYYDVVQEQQFKEIIEKEKPDLLHVFGTEFPHALAAVKAFGNPARTLIHIQGMASVYALHFMANLPWKVQKAYTFRDLLRGENLIRQQEKFRRRGIYEKQAIRLSGHILGRTDWDKACTKQIQPKAHYHFCGETLRDSFYLEENQWSVENCERHSIFLSQGSYPIKGLHYVLESLPLILKRYPDTKVYVAGDNIGRDSSVKDRLRQTAYGRYVCGMLDRKNLRNHVVFTGFLEEGQMCARYRKSHVFVCPSSIENSPNSVGEAMMLGMPVVSADMGGVSSMLAHGREGLLYQADAPYMLAYYVMEIFGDDKRAKALGSRARERAAVSHDRRNNLAQVLSAYREALQRV